MAAKKKPSKGGRPSSYKSEYVEQAKKLARLGATDKEMADFFNVAESTFHKWKLDHLEFSESLKKGKLLSDANVANALYHRAIGYEHEDTHFSAYEGNVTATTYTKHYPPDTAAAFIWLKNRQKEKWRDKSEQEQPKDLLEKVSELINKLPS